MVTPRYIELVGLAGAGKTSMANALSTLFRQSGIKTSLREPIRAGLFLRVRLLFSVCRLCALHPSLLLVCVPSIRREYRNTPHVRTVVRNLRTRLLLEAVIVRYLSKYHQVFINDEGITDRVLVLFVLTYMSEDRAISLLQLLLPQSAKLIYVNVPSEVAIERESKREVDLPFFNEMSKKTKTVFFKRSADTYEVFLDKLQHLLGTKIRTYSISNIGADVTIKQSLSKMFSVLNS